MEETYMTLKWMLYRITHRKRTYILLGLLLIGFSVTGGVTKSYSKDFELMTLNMAFATNFDTMEAWQSWHMHWQYTWLVSAIGMVGLFPFLANMIPNPNTPESTVPVIMGQSRSSLFFAQLVCYDLAAIVLWLGYLIVGYLFGHIPLRPLFSAGYYFRTISYALLLQLGYANLSLTVALLFRNRILGILAAFAALTLTNVLKNLGFFMNVLSTISYSSRDRDQLWMWAVDSHPVPFQLLTLILFPVITTALCCLVGLIQIHRRDLA